jgi:hypothetical protein
MDKIRPTNYFFRTESRSISSANRSKEIEQNDTDAGSEQQSIFSGDGAVLKKQFTLDHITEMSINTDNMPVTTARINQREQAKNQAVKEEMKDGHPDTNNVKTDGNAHTVDVLAEAIEPNTKTCCSCNIF